jgi:type IV pilus assembly protein PilA
MLHQLNTRRAHSRKDEGFTLIELMVVVLIIAILLAIAIPTFLGAQDKAKDRSSQSSLRNTLTAAVTIYSDSIDGYTSADAAALLAVEPSLAFTAAGVASTGPKEVSVLGEAEIFYAAAVSKTGTCFYIRDNKGGPGTEFAKVDAGACTGNAAKALAAGWSQDGWAS